MKTPYEHPTAFDRASFYVEELKYGVGPGQVEAASPGQMVIELDSLLADAKVTSITGQELYDALPFYGDSLAENFAGFMSLRQLTLSCFADGVMHGIALAGGLEGQTRNPRGS